MGAGALLARTTDKPWGLVFLERSGRTALSELPGAGLGFLSASGWARVTRVLRGRRSGRAYAPRWPPTTRLAAVSHCASRPTGRA